jgi:hypothetical protein
MQRRPGSVLRQQDQCGALRQGYRVPRWPDRHEVCQPLKAGRPRSAIPLPDGDMPMTLGDAGRYIAGLPSKAQDRSEWQAAAAIPTPFKRLKKLPID